MKRESNSAPRNPWVTIALMVTPLFALAALMGLLMVKSGVLEMVKIELELRERRDREATLSQAISNGATPDTTYGGSSNPRAMD